MESKQKGKISPSRAPILFKCAFFSGKKSTSSSAGRGTLIDDALRDAIENGLDSYEIREKYVDDFIQPILYGYNFVLNNMYYPVASKKECRIKSCDERIGDGEVDCIDTESGIIVDFKTGQMRDYYYQMLFYAHLVFLQNHELDKIICYVCFLDKERHEKYTFTRNRARRAIDEYFDYIERQTEPNPSAYCSWCEKKYVCSKRIGVVNEFMRESSSLTKDNILSDEKTLKRFLDGAPMFIDLYESVKQDCISSLRNGGKVKGYRLQTQCRKSGLVYILKKEQNGN